MRSERTTTKSGTPEVDPELCDSSLPVQGCADREVSPLPIVVVLAIGEQVAPRVIAIWIPAVVNEFGSSLPSGDAIKPQTRGPANYSNGF